MRVLGLLQAVVQHSSFSFGNHSNEHGHIAGHGKRALAFLVCLMRRGSPFAAILSSGTEKLYCCVDLTS